MSAASSSIGLRSAPPPNHQPPGVQNIRVFMCTAGVFGERMCATRLMPARPEPRVLGQPRDLLARGQAPLRPRVEPAVHGRDVDADLLEDPALAHHRHHAAAARPRRRRRAASPSARTARPAARRRVRRPAHPRAPRRRRRSGRAARRTTPPRGLSRCRRRSPPFPRLLSRRRRISRAPARRPAQPAPSSSGAGPVHSPRGPEFQANVMRGDYSVAAACTSRMTRKRLPPQIFARSSSE